MRSSRDFMLLSPPERAEAAEPLGDEGSLGPDPERPFVPPALYLPSTGVPNARGAEIELRRLRDGQIPCGKLLVFGHTTGPPTSLTARQ